MSDLKTFRDSLELIAELCTGEGYEWDEVRVWKYRPSGRVYFYSAGGCSCNDFWEDLYSLTDLTELREDTWKQLEREAERIDASAPNRIEFLMKARQALKR